MTQTLTTHTHNTHLLTHSHIHTKHTHTHTHNTHTHTHIHTHNTHTHTQKEQGSLTRLRDVVPSVAQQSAECLVGINSFVGVS